MEDDWANEPRVFLFEYRRSNCGELCFGTETDFEIIENFGKYNRDEIIKEWFPYGLGYVIARTNYFITYGAIRPLFAGGGILRKGEQLK